MSAFRPTIVITRSHRVARRNRRVIFVLVAFAVILTGCVSTPPYVYHYIPGRTATTDNGYAVAPHTAPFFVQVAIDAGNELIGKPYRYGGGHRTFDDDAYDCSGAVCYVLHSIGRMNTPTPSSELRRYGDSGPGRWITIYASSGHSFLVVAGLRFDTGYGIGANGPHWLTRSRPADEFVMRHPIGL
ncbi:MAG TPA: hypothetical protein VE860_14375 [Chthoniobacterales bacterium]|nr:hypothetical protein [Chthoniobacterales bacterium]